MDLGHLFELVISGAFTGGVAWGAMRANARAVADELKNFRAETHRWRESIDSQMRMILDKLIPNK